MPDFLILKVRYFQSTSHYLIMYSKDELLSKDISELADIAQNLDAEYQADDTKENIIYSILDRQAIVEGTKSSAANTKRKRVRIVKKDTDRVYSVNGKEGENFDVKKNKVTNEPVPLFKDELPAPPVEEVKEETPAAEPKPTPAKRGRKSKAEKEALAAAAALEAKAKEEQPTNDTEPTPESVDEAIQPTPEVQEIPSEQKPEEEIYTVPEASFTPETQDDEKSNDLLAQLQAKVNAHNEANEER